MPAGELAQIGYEMPDPLICCIYQANQGTLQQCRQAATSVNEKADEQSRIESFID